MEKAFLPSLSAVVPAAAVAATSAAIAAVATAAVALLSLLLSLSLLLLSILLLLNASPSVVFLVLSLVSSPAAFTGAIWMLLLQLRLDFFTGLHVPACHHHMVPLRHQSTSYFFSWKLKEQEGEAGIV